MFRRLCFVLLCAMLSLCAVPSLANAAPGDVTITAPGSDGEDPTPLIQGTADPSPPVHVVIDGVEVAAVTPAADGAWEYQVTEPIAPETSINIDAIIRDEMDTPLGSASLSYYVWEELSVITVQSPSQGDAIGPYYAVDAAVTHLAFLDDTIRLLFDGQPVTDPRVVRDDIEGYLQLQVEDAQFTDGPHTLQIVAEDRHGREVQSEVIDVVADATPPGAIVITSPRNGEVITDRTPTFSGTADAGTEVRLAFEGSGEPLCDAITDASGHWACQPTGHGAEWFASMEGKRGDVTIFAISRDAVGNLSFTSLAFTVDFRKPAGGTGTTTPKPTPTTSSPKPTTKPTVKPTPSATPVGSGDGATNGSGTPPLAQTGASPAVPLIVAGALLFIGFGLRRLSGLRHRA
ncbi:hypothetical protein [Janibacter sp. HTCC2649]|uniref:hypothetical protein n=1 Tax=Janibacter sp. HTCC2649 TaxID=313589 RepID=UPI0002F11E87|nr:hypothetical protein [Janibacter sp. HTCC2649]